MRSPSNKVHIVGLRTRLLLGASLLMMVLGLGCVIFGDCAPVLFASGRIVDGVTGEAIAGASMGGVALSDGIIISFIDPYDVDGEPFNASAADGSFEIVLSLNLTSCPAPPFPAPDEFRVVVSRNGCVVEILVPVNPGEFIEDEGGSSRLTFASPISVPPCEE